jgi:1-acyl-sn-glycerol-3-phosphate acyltransferase
MMGGLCRFFLRCIGWKATGTQSFLHIPKYIIAIGPHTSNWDFLIGILVKYAYKLDSVRYLGKESLFKAPHGFIFRALGGYPVIRSGGLNQVDAYIQAFNKNTHFAIVIAPEGTRKKVDRLKTGYYYIAKGAQIPIIPATMDYTTRTVIFENPFYPGDNGEDDLKTLDLFFRKTCGKYPEFSYGFNHSIHEIN